jgi:hypothetical protein
MLPSHTSLALAFDADLHCTAPLDHIVNAEADGHGIVQAMAAATAAIRGRTQLHRRDADRHSDCRPPSLRYGTYRDGYHTQGRQQAGISPDQL